MRLFLAAALVALTLHSADEGAGADGSTPLLVASHRDDRKAVESLIRAGADVNAANDLGATPLWAACQNGNAAIVGLLLEAGANPNAKLLRGETPLMMAARGGYPEIVTGLLTKGADPNARGPRGQTALMWAVSNQHPDVVKILLAKGADVLARSDAWTDVMAVEPHGYLPYNKAIPHGADTALLFAARVGSLESAKMLVASGAKVDDADAWGVSATTLAAHSGFQDLVDFLLEKGADPNASPNGFTALHESIMRRDEKMVRSLLEHGADPNIPLRTWTPKRRASKDFFFPPALVGASPLWLAARFLQPGVMRMLAAKGADPKFVLRSVYVTDGRFQERKEVTTPLLAALGMGGPGAAWVDPPPGDREALTLETVKLAVELGVDINVANTDGRKALDVARGLRHGSVVKFLEEKSK